MAWYDDAHVERLERIRALKDEGVPLAVIERLLSGELAGSDEALAAALTEAAPARGQGTEDEQHGEQKLTRAELAARAGVSEAVLDAIEREGFLLPSSEEAEPRYTLADAEAVEAGVGLLEAGVPLGELLDVARRYDRAIQDVAEQAVDTFVRFVRDPIQGSAASEQEATERLLTAFREMLPAAESLVAHHFRRLVLSKARARIEADGDESELAVLRDEGLGQ